MNEALSGYLRTLNILLKTNAYRPKMPTLGIVIL